MTSSSLSIMEQKAQLRKLIARRRSDLPGEQRAPITAIICQRVIEHLQEIMQERDVLYTYIPFRTELNIWPIVEWCWKNEIQVAAPRVLPIQDKLEFRFIKAIEDLQPQPPWGIYEPSEGTPVVEYQLHKGFMLLPGLAFDSRRTRLGYGGGYYDKFMHEMSERDVSIYKLAAAMDLQMVEEVPAEVHDTNMDTIITETRII